MSNQYSNCGAAHLNQKPLPLFLTSEIQAASAKSNRSESGNFTSSRDAGRQFVGATMASSVLYRKITAFRSTSTDASMLRASDGMPIGNQLWSEIAPARFAS